MFGREPSQDAYAQAYADRWLLAGEEMVTYGWARLLSTRQHSTSRGTLIFTTRRLAHWPQGASTPGWRVDVESVSDVRVTWAPWRMRVVRPVLSDGTASVELQVPVRLARILRAALTDRN